VNRRDNSGSMWSECMVRVSTLTKSFMLKRSVSPFLAATAAMPSALPPASASSPCAQEACVGRRQVCLGLAPSACPSMCACAPCIRVCVHVHEWEQEARVPRGGAHARGGGGVYEGSAELALLGCLSCLALLGVSKGVCHVIVLGPQRRHQRLPAFYNPLRERERERERERARAFASPARRRIVCAPPLRPQPPRSAPSGEGVRTGVEGLRFQVVWCRG
jgi:hypothetical protein